ncbi:MAG: transposase [Gammaproteobacteria bacterium]|nr:transposase [Gammaproteobacteria bacterium]
MWFARGGPPVQKVLLYHYALSRSGAVPHELLEGFTGTLQTDGYAGAAARHLIGVCCCTYARCKFDEASTVPPGVEWDARSASVGGAPRMARIRAHGKGAKAKTSRAHHETHVQAVLTQLRAWLDTALPQVPPGTATGLALGYLDRLQQFCVRTRLSD